MSISILSRLYIHVLPSFLLFSVSPINDHLILWTYCILRHVCMSIWTHTDTHVFDYVSIYALFLDQLMLSRSFVQLFIYLIMINMFRRVNLISLIENSPMKAITKLTSWMIKHLSAAAKIISSGVWTNVYPSDRKTDSEFTKKSIHIRSHRGRKTMKIAKTFNDGSIVKFW